jgi:hypothetical protein
MKCWYSAFNAQVLRLIIVVVQLGAVKIYVAAVEALTKKERQGETQFTTKIDGFLSFIPPLNANNVLFCMFFFNVTLCVTKLRVLVLCFSYFTDNSIKIGVFCSIYVDLTTL